MCGTTSKTPASSCMAVGPRRTCARLPASSLQMAYVLMWTGLCSLRTRSIYLYGGDGSKYVFTLHLVHTNRT